MTSIAIRPLPAPLPRLDDLDAPAIRRIVVDEPDAYMPPLPHGLHVALARGDTGIGAEHVSSA